MAGAGADAWYLAGWLLENCRGRQVGGHGNQSRARGYHSNPNWKLPRQVETDGVTCLDGVKQQWSPSQSLPEPAGMEILGAFRCQLKSQVQHMQFGVVLVGSDPLAQHWQPQRLLKDDSGHQCCKWSMGAGSSLDFKAGNAATIDDLGAASCARVSLGSGSGFALHSLD